MSPQEVKLPYLNRIRNRHRPGEHFFYYRRAGKNVPIEGDVGSSNWHQNYQRIHSSFESGSKPVDPRRPEDIFGEVVKVYLASQRFVHLKDKSKMNYRKVLERVMPIFGDIPIGDINARHLSELRDKIAEQSPRKAKETLKVLRLVFKTAFERAIIKFNPAEGIDNPIGYKAEPWRPWTQAEIALFQKKARPVWRRAMMVLLYTGQRRSDAIEMRRDDIKDDMIQGIAAKTGKTVFIPIHRELARELTTPLPIESVYLICGQSGQKMTKQWLTNGMTREWRRIGSANPPPLHGLRKNAVMALIEAGATEDGVNAITGQSREMVRHYAQDYERKGLAKAAILKWEKADGGKKG